MIDAVKAIEKIKIHLKTQIDNGTLNGTYQESTTSISFYVYKTPNTTEPLLTLRVTDHRPDLQKYIRPNAPRPSIEPNTNMSIEFYIPKMDVRGNIKQNKYRNKVLSPSNISVVQPFSVSSYNYDSRKLDIGDDDIILNAVMDWVQNSHGKYPYKDPFENTPKAAKELTKTAKVSIIGKNAVDTNISNGNYGADYVSESRNNNKTDKNESKIMSKKNTIRLTESDLKRVISESVKNIISELDWRTYANAAAAAKDRESLFKDDPGYPDRPMTRHYKDVEKYQRDSDWQVNQSKQPEKFRRAAYSELSKEICGEEDFALFLAKYIPQHGVDDKLKKMLQQYNDGQEYIRNNKTQWSKRR